MEVFIGRGVYIIKRVARRTSSSYIIISCTMFSANRKIRSAGQKEFVLVTVRTRK